MVSYIKSNKMKHEQIHKDLIFYLDNELSDKKRKAVEEHLAECADCQSFLAFLKEEMHIIEKEKNPEASPYFFTRLSARLDERPEFKSQGLWVRLAQPAFFSILLIAGIYGGLRLGSNASTGIINPNMTGTVQLMNDFAAEPIESFLLDEL
jgi:anti-sigma factor RsiW